MIITSPAKKRRNYLLHSDSAERCQYTVLVNGRKGDECACFRLRKVGNYCRQHAKMIEKQNAHTRNATRTPPNA